MQHAEKMMPDEPMWALGAAQCLAETVVQLEAHLAAEQRAVLIGVGAKALVKLILEEDADR